MRDLETTSAIYTKNVDVQYHAQPQKFPNMPAATQVPARCPGAMIHHFEGIAAYITLKVIPTILGEICADYAAFM